MERSIFTTSRASRLTLAALAGVLVAGLANGSPASAATVYLALGDSITESWEGWDNRCPGPECGYPGRLETRLRASGVDARVRNYGLGGEKTWMALERIDGVLAQNPDADVLLLMEGSNDISQEIGPETTLFNLEEIASRAGKKGVDTVHATLLPRWPAAAVDSANVLNQELAWMIRAMAWKYDRPLVDPFAVFLAIPDVFATHYSTINPNDVVGHPNTQGFDLLADTFFDVLMDRDEVGPVLGFVSPEDGALQVPSSSAIRVRLFDFGSGIDVAGTQLYIDGIAVRYTTSGDSRRVDLTHVPSLPLAGTVTVGIATQDLATPVNGWNRQVARFTVGGAIGDLQQNEIDAEKESADAVRSHLSVSAPNSSHPVVTILTPGRDGGVTVSSHTAQHDRGGATYQAAESRIVYRVAHGSLESRQQATPVHTTTLTRVDPASDLVTPGSPGLLQVRLANGEGETLAIDNGTTGLATDSGLSAALAATGVSDHEQKLLGRDWLELDMLHEILSVQICDNVSGASTVCHDAWAAASRRAAPDKIQIRFGCQGTSCGEGYMNLIFRYGGSGRVERVEAELLTTDPRFNLQREAILYFKSPRPPGVRWFDPPTLVLDNQALIAARTVDLTSLHADADATRLDPNAE